MLFPPNKFTVISNRTELMLKIQTSKGTVYAYFQVTTRRQCGLEEQFPSKEHMQFLPHFCGAASSSSLLSYISLLDTVNRMCIRFIHQWICLELSGGRLRGSQLYKDEDSLHQKLSPSNRTVF